MKLYFKILFIVLFVIVCLYFLFVFEESYRLLNNASDDSIPLIVIREEKGKNITTYRSLGFKLTNKYGMSMLGDKDSLISQEFWLFDSFLIWSWIT
jgi:hypothetical protein